MLTIDYTQVALAIILIVAIALFIATRALATNLHEFRVLSTNCANLEPNLEPNL